MKNILRLLLIFTLSLSPSALVLAQTTTSPVSSEVEQLQQQIKALLAQIEELKSEVEAFKTELKFTKALRRGMTGEEVKELQEFLKKFPDIYPEGLVTGYFGSLTETAVKKLQEKQGIETVGFVGPKTLEKLNELVTEGAGVSGVTPPGLLTAPGIQKKIEVPVTAVLPATPATPAVPAQPTATATPAIPAVPATPTTPQTTTVLTSATSTTISPTSLTAIPLPGKPWDVAVSGSDYIVTTVDLDKSTGRLLRITADGKVSTIASLNKRLAGVAISGSDYYVLDGDTNVLKISPDGAVSTIVNLITSGIGTGAYFQNDIAINNSDLIVTDYSGGRLLRVASTTKAVSTIAFGLRHPNSVIVDGSDFIVLAADPNDTTPNLYRVTPTGTVILIASLGGKLGTLGSVTKISSDFYANSNSAIARVSSSGIVTLLPLSLSGKLISLATNGSNIIATDYTTNRLLLIPSAPTVAATTATSGTTLTTSTTSTATTQSSPSTGGITSTAPVTTSTQIITTTTIATSTTATSSVATVTTSSTSTATNTISDITPPSTPIGFSAYATSSSQINLSWTASTDNVGIAGYKVYRNGAFLTNTTLNFYSDIGLTASTNYSYTVAAYDAAGNLSSQSSSVSATTLGGTATACSGLTLTFQNNKTSYISGEWVKYTWTCTPSGSASYVEVQVVKPDGTTAPVHYSEGSAKTLEFQSATFGSGNYTLRACFSSGCSSVIASLPFTITATCTESWTCGDWSSCSNSAQTRTCTDANNCGTTSSKPAVSQSCAVTATSTIPAGITPTRSGNDGTWCYVQSSDLRAKGYCQDTQGTHYDYCENTTTLRDWYCTGGSTNVRCSAGEYNDTYRNATCSDGALIYPSASLPKESLLAKVLTNLSKLVSGIRNLLK